MTMLEHALAYAAQNLPVFPLRARGKEPAIASPHPEGSDERKNCHGECGLEGHGLYDATTNPDTIRRWWAKYPNANIAARLPEGVIALDADGPDRKPHPGTGMEGLAELREIHGPDFLTETYRQITGSGGMHILYRRPPGKLTKKKLAPYGLDFKDHGGYIVMAPSIHPDSGRAYQAFPAPIAAMPAWLIRMMIVPTTTKPIKLPYRVSGAAFRAIGGPSIADAFCESTTWAEVLMPHGWTAVGNDTEGDGAKWLHPTATSSCSATIRNGCLFVYSSNTPFVTTSAGAPEGYKKFKAAAVLAHPHLTEREAMSTFARTLRIQGIAS
jgi:hypothetical protein